MTFFLGKIPSYSAPALALLNGFEPYPPQNPGYATVVCMENITDDGSRLWSSDSLTDARTLLLAISTTGFLSALVVTNGCMQYLLGLTCSLQAEAKDIVQAVAEINHVLTTLKDVRKNVAVHHPKWFAKVEQMCEDLSVEPTLPRRCARQQHRSNVPAQNVSDYYLRVITIPLLDHLVSGLEARFSSHQQTALQGLFLVLSILTTKTIEEVSPKIKQLGSMYEEDIPFFSSLESELHCWHIKWKSQEQEHGQSSLPNSPSLTLPHVTRMFPNIKVLLHILCTLPVTSCSAERSFSGLKRIKTSLRSTMGNQRLTSLTILHLHRDIDISVPEVMDEFARRHPRRLQLVDIFAD